jgi:alpha-galactosidase
MVEKNGIDIYRQDFNMEPLPFWRESDEENRRGITEMKYIEGLYALWDSLIERFPKILIDNCSSGGRRIDFETCERAVPLWRSDTGCFPESSEQHISVWNNNQILSLTEVLPYQAAGVWSTAPYDFRAAATNGKEKK